MTAPTPLTILNNATVAERTSAATRAVLEARAQKITAPSFLSVQQFALLQLLVDIVLPQDTIGTGVEIAAHIDQRLAEGTNAGWRFADLPADGEAYRRALNCIAELQRHTGAFEGVSIEERKAFLQKIANGEEDRAAQFALSKWVGMLKTDAVKVWLAHPEAMEKLGIYSFADGRTGHTDGPTEDEGWAAIMPASVLPFEKELA